MEYDREEHGRRARMLPNFSWLVEDRLAGVAYPGSDDAFSLLHTLGIRALVTLHERPLPADMLAKYGLLAVQVAIPDFTAPTVEQVEEVIAAINSFLTAGLPVAVHCGAGFGRTGTMLACYLVWQGRTAADAIATVRQQRPHSIETADQEDLVSLYERSLQR